ncbi:MAG: PDZ domain-containing protein [Bdellovibrionales bacterium]|nr:PDZ domain-containing protein [Bdellovibrionales bacterium]
MKLYLIVSTIVFLSFQVFAQSIEETEEQKVAKYWQEANVQDAEIAKYITEENCSSDPQVYFGCYSAVATLVANTYEKANLLLASLPKRPWEVSVTTSYKNFEIRNHNPDLFPKKRSLEERIQLQKEEEESRKKIGALYSNVENSQELMRILSETLAKLNAEKRSQTIAQAVQSYFVYGIDAHAHIHTIPEYEDMMKPEVINETFYGIGATLMQNDDRVQITEPLPSSPAIEAGLQVGDIIAGVDGESVTGQALKDVVSKIRGPANTSVKLTIIRDEKELNYTVTRRSVTVENLSTRVLKTKEKETVLYVQLRTFMEQGICKRFIETIEESLKAEKTSNLIIDLRNNGGGLMNEALCMAGAFYQQSGPLLGVWDLNRNAYVEKYQYVYSSQRVSRQPEVSRQPDETQVKNISSVLKGKRAVILINAGSASASEIFAGIMQDMNLGVTVGIKSFGKATIQQPREYDTVDRNMLVMFRTIARFHLPTGRTNQITGIKADVEAYMSPNPKPEETYFMREEQLFSHAVKPAENNYVTPTDVATKTSECITSRKPADEYNAEMAKYGFSDYQKIMATTIAACL